MRRSGERSPDSVVIQALSSAAMTTLKEGRSGGCRGARCTRPATLLPCRPARTLGAGVGSFARPRAAVTAFLESANAKRFAVVVSALS